MRMEVEEHKTTKTPREFSSDTDNLSIAATWLLESGKILSVRFLRKPNRRTPCFSHACEDRNSQVASRQGKRTESEGGNPQTE